MKTVFLVLLLFFSAKLSAGRLPFGNREEIVYNIRWLFINCGRSSLTIEREDEKLWKITSVTRSLPFFDNFYKVRDRIEAWWDLDAGRSLRYEKHIREGRHKRDIKIEVDPQKNEARWKKNIWKVTSNALDVLTALYHIRLQELKVGKEFEIDVYTKKKLWPLKVKVLRYEKIKVQKKRYRTFVVEPAMREEGIFKAKGKILVWITDDERKIPVKMASKIPIGSIIAEMTKVVSGKE